MSNAADSAVKKLEAFFQTLDQDEKEVVSEMIRASLLGVADSSSGEVGAFSSSSFVGGLTSANAPTLLGSIGLPSGFVAGRGIAGGTGPLE